MTEWWYDILKNIWCSLKTERFIDLGRVKTAEFELCQHGGTLIFDGIFFYCFQDSDALNTDNSVDLFSESENYASGRKKTPSKFKKLRHFCWRLCIKILLVFWTVKCEAIERCSTDVTVFKEAQFRLNYGFGANSFTILSLFYENFEVHDFPLINSQFLVWL